MTNSDGGRRGRGWALNACAICAGLLVAAPAASAAGPDEVLDANCPGPAAATVSFASASAPSGRYAQSFTVASSGRLTSAQATVNNAGGTADYVVQIVAVDVSGAPTNTVLASSSVAGASVPSGEATISPSFANPLSVTAGEQYALVVTRPGGTNLRARVRTTNPCPGALYSSSSQLGSFALSGSGGVRDLLYAVFITPFPVAPGAAPGQAQLPSSPAPITRILRQPLNRTLTRAVTYRFEANEPASFECRLDKRSFAPCSSPQRYARLHRGKHTFQVRAIDAVGNVDPTPDKDSFKVVR